MELNNEKETILIKKEAAKLYKLECQHENSIKRLIHAHREQIQELKMNQQNK